MHGAHCPTLPHAKHTFGRHAVQAFEEGLGQWLGPLPTDLLTQPNAEFAATREAIQARPLEFYQAARHWLMTTSMRSYIAGAALERFCLVKDYLSECSTATMIE